MDLATGRVLMLDAEAMWLMQEQLLQFWSTLALLGPAELAIRSRIQRSASGDFAARARQVGTAMRENN